MNQNLIDLVLILDKSGSMSGLENDTIGGYNSMIEKQKKENDEILVSTILFDTEVTTIYDSADINDIEPLTKEQYFACGCTALLDAVGSTIKKIDKKHKELGEDAPAKTLVVITTDGYENASKEYGYENIKNLIEEKKKEGWEFIFLGADIDAVHEASSIGIDAGHAVNFKKSSKGIAKNFESILYCANEIRVDKHISPKFKEFIEKEDEGK